MRCHCYSAPETIIVAGIKMSYLKKGPGPIKGKITHLNQKVESKTTPAYGVRFHHRAKVGAKPLMSGCCFYILSHSFTVESESRELHIRKN